MNREVKEVTQTRANGKRIRVFEDGRVIMAELSHPTPYSFDNDPYNIILLAEPLEGMLIIETTPVYEIV